MSKIPVVLDNDNQKLVGYIRFTDLEVRDIIAGLASADIPIELTGEVLIKNNGDVKLLHLSINQL